MPARTASAPLVEARLTQGYVPPALQAAALGPVRFPRPNGQEENRPGRNPADSFNSNFSHPEGVQPPQEPSWSANFEGLGLGKQRIVAGHPHGFAWVILPRTAAAP
jgi:hypothetical protein